MPAHQAGDTIIAFASRDGSTIPTLPPGWTNIVSENRAVGTGNWGARIGYKVAASSSETVGTWTNALAIVVVVYRGVTAIGASATGSGAANKTITYPALTLQATNNQSWVARFVRGGGSSSATSDLDTNPIAGYVQRAGQPNGGGNSAIALDTNGPVTTNPTADTQVTTNTNYWFAATVELLGPDDAGQFFALF